MDISMKSPDEDKMILFPNLTERLIEKATSLMKEEDFQAALSLFLQGLELEEENEQMQYGAVVCFFEMGNLTEAKSYCKKLLHGTTDNYYEVLQIYLTILVQQSDYAEAFSFVEALLQEQDVPTPYAQHFKHLMSFCEAQMNGAETTTNTAQSEVFPNLSLYKEEKQLLLLQEIKGMNLAYFEKELNEALIHSSVHPYVKSALLNEIVNQKVQGKWKVQKFAHQNTYDTQDLESLLRHPFIGKVEKRLEDELFHHNPTLYQMVTDVWKRYLFVVFPFIPTEKEDLWACGLHLLLLEIGNVETAKEEVMELYNVNELDLKKIMNHLKEVETYTTVE